MGSVSPQSCPPAFFMTPRRPVSVDFPNPGAVSSTLALLDLNGELTEKLSFHH
jgi:hypothetical protein